MEKFAIVAVNEKGEAVEFFNGATFVPNQKDIAVFDDKSKAKFYFGRAYQSFTDKELKLISINVELSLNVPVATAPALVVENA
ncbi:hypothetical protein ACE1CI_15570 [Aerosakkonemataceae cyanobacterium BLCC-F50]|uniref:Uncharacterized protein n=1 Tax=Floridaenema flaviceps BLCC-F50 TaxID=3153642 RepID=A0ABV4XRH8_9CYAN